MKSGVVALALVGAGFVAASGVCGWLLATYMPGVGPVDVFLGAGIVTRMMVMLALLLHLPIAGLGVAALATGRGQFGLPLAILAAASTAVGLLGGLYVVMTVQQIIAAIGPVRFEITAPSYAEAALSLATGLFGATLALGGGVLGDRRR